MIPLQEAGKELAPSPLRALVMGQMVNAPLRKKGMKEGSKVTRRQVLAGMAATALDGVA